MCHDCGKWYEGDEIWLCPRHADERDEQEESSSESEEEESDDEDSA